MPLYEPGTFNSKTRWMDFIEKDELLEQCKTVLDFYIDWWLSGNNLKKDDAEQFFKENGIFDSMNEINKDEFHCSDCSTSLYS